jgi:hypothetical protein
MIRLVESVGALRIDERVDQANSIAFVDPVFEGFRQQRRLRPFHPCNEALHQRYHTAKTLIGLRSSVQFDQVNCSRRPR